MFIVGSVLEEIRKRFGGDSEEIRKRFGRDSEKIRKRFGRDSEEIRKRFGRDSEEIRKRFGRDSEEIRKRFGRYSEDTVVEMCAMCMHFFYFSLYVWRSRKRQSFITTLAEQHCTFYNIKIQQSYSLKKAVIKFTSFQHSYVFSSLTNKLSFKLAPNV